MLTDYLSEKQVLIEGKPRGGGVLPWEPVYLTTSILECILECTHKQERGVIATFLSFLKYIESELVREIDRCGIDLIKKIRNYHENIKSWVDNNKLWGDAKEKEQEISSLNKTLKEHHAPNQKFTVLKNMKNTKLANQGQIK